MVLLVTSLTVASAAEGESPSNPCGSYPTFNAAAGGAGIRTLQTWPGVIPDVATVDGYLPGAEAQVGSPGGSTAWAGAAYSSLTGAAGQAQIDPGQVPIFAMSSYPLKPESGNSLPGSDVHAKSDVYSSTATAVSGTPPSDNGSTGQTSASGTASCTADGTVRSSADTKANAVDIKGVLRIGAVATHAEAAIDPSGKASLNGTIDVEGVTVLGQSVAITEQGLEVPGATTPLPDNPLLKALSDAGITVRYIAADKDSEHGSVTAPGVEIVISGAPPGAGTGPATSTYTFGQAYATAERGAGGAAAASDSSTGGSTLSASPPIGGTPLGNSPAKVAAPGASPSLASGASLAAGDLPNAAPMPITSASTAGTGQTGVRQVALARLDDISYATAYGVVVAALLLLAISVLFKRVGGNLRWR